MSARETVERLYREKQKLAEQNHALIKALESAQSVLSHCKADIGYSSEQKRVAIEIEKALQKSRGEIK